MAKHELSDKDDGPTPTRKRVVFIHGEIKTPPFSDNARREAGGLLGRLQDGELLKMPSAELLPTVGPRCGALRIRDAQHNWRIMYRADPTVILVVDVYDKKTQKIPDQVIDQCKKRLQKHDEKRNEAN